MKDKWLEALLRDKFVRDESLAFSLRDTGDKDLIFSNTNDSWLGAPQEDGHKGMNTLGILLRSIRHDAYMGSDLKYWLQTCHNLEQDENAQAEFILMEDRANSSPVEHIISGMKPKTNNTQNKSNDKKNTTQKQNINVSDGEDEETKEKRQEEEKWNFYQTKGSSVFWMGHDKSGVRIACNEPSVSPRHALLFLTSKGVSIVDVGRPTGLTVNGVKQEPFIPCSLKYGDILRLGGATITYRVAVLNMDAAKLYLEKQLRTAKLDSLLLATALSDPKKAAEMEKHAHARLLVSNLSYNTSKDALKELIKSYVETANVEEIFFPFANPHRRDGTHRQENYNSSASVSEKGYGFVTMGSTAEAKRVVAILGQGTVDLNGRRVFMKFAESRSGSQVLQTDIMRQDRRHGNVNFAKQEPNSGYDPRSSSRPQRRAHRSPSPSLHDRRQFATKRERSIDRLDPPPGFRAGPSTHDVASPYHRSASPPSYRGRERRVASPSSPRHHRGYSPSPPPKRRRTEYRSVSTSPPRRKRQISRSSSYESTRRRRDTSRLPPRRRRSLSHDVPSPYEERRSRRREYSVSPPRKSSSLRRERSRDRSISSSYSTRGAKHRQGRSPSPRPNHRLENERRNRYDDSRYEDRYYRE